MSWSSPHDEEQMGEQVTAQHLSVTLGVTVIDVLVFDDDFVTVLVIAGESHHGIFAALDLPTIGVGWGHRYLEQDRELFDAVPLVTA